MAGALSRAVGGQLRSARSIAGPHENRRKTFESKAKKERLMMTTGKLTMETIGDRAIVITRVFDAPRRMVFDAFTKPELVPQWLIGPPGSSMPICEIDLRVGGAYRYVLTGPGYPEMTIRGVFREVLAPERVVVTESFEPAWYEGENINTTTFVEAAGMTTVM